MAQGSASVGFGFAALLAACGGLSGTNGVDTGGAMGNGAGGSGAASGTGGVIEFGGASGAGGTSAGSSVSYGAVVTNVSNCCDYVTILRADYAANTCIFFDIAIEADGAVKLPRIVSAFPGADHCCPSDPLFAALCDTDAGCPVATSVTGAITVGSGKLDIDLALDFEPAAWLVATVDFDVQNLSRAGCPVRKGLPPCLQPRDSGRCDAVLARFAFDPVTLACGPFVYGGCGGNENRFETPEACAAACVAPLADACAETPRGRGCPCTRHDQCSGVCSSVPYEQGEECVISSVGYCKPVSEGNCACRLDTGERACGA